MRDMAGIETKVDRSVSPVPKKSPASITESATARQAPETTSALTSALERACILKLGFTNG